VQKPKQKVKRQQKKTQGQLLMASKQAGNTGI